MPNWKKVIVSGSNAALNSLNVTNGITGSLLGTSSYATQALTASNANTASYVNQLNQSVVVSGSLTVSGSTNFVGSTGTTLFSANADTLTFTGSIYTSGSIVSTGSLSITSITSSLLGTASYATQALTASYANTATSASYALTASNIQGGTQYYIPVWNTNTSLTSSYLNQSGSILKTIYSGQDRGLTLDYNTNSFILGNTGVGNSTYLQVFDGGSTINIYSPNYTYFNDKVGVRIIPTNPGLAVSGALEVTGPGTSKFMNNNVQITGSLNTTGSNILIGDTYLTGSLNITGSTLQVGNNTLQGNTTLSGSIIISGSTGPGAATASVQIYGDIRQSGYHRFDPVTTNIDTSVSASYIYVSGSTNDLYFSQNSAGYSNTTRLRWIEGNLYTGLLHGGLITTQSSTVYQISSGSGIIVNLNASLNDDPYPTIQYLNWPNLSASIAPLTASYQQAFVSIDSSGNIYQQGTPYAAGQFDTEINIGVVLFQNGSTINAVKTQPSVAYGFEQSQNIFNRAFGPLKLSGFTLAPSGSSTRSLLVGSGTAYSPGSNYAVDPNNPSYAIDSGTSVSKIFRYYQSGSTWVYLTNAGAGFTEIDPTQYSNNGTLDTVDNNRWSIQRVFWFPNSVAKAIVVYYGNNEYSTEAEAIANINIESFVEAPNTAANAVYLGAIVIKGDGVFTTDTDFTIVPGGLFRSVGGSGGGGSIITTTLAGLSDVSISGPTSGQALVYDTTAAKWRNLSFISASISGNAATATSSSYAATASLATTASNANTASYFSGTSLTISQSLTINQNTASLASGAQTISTNLTGSYTSAFYKYTLASGSNARAGQVMAVWNGANIQYTDVATNDIGTTSNVALTASLSGGNVLLTTTLPSSGWTVKTLVNLL